MTLRSILRRPPGPPTAIFGTPHRHVEGHDGLSRRQFMALGAGAGAALATGSPRESEAQENAHVRFDGSIEDCSPAPVPVPGDPALGGLHVWLPVPGVEPNSLFHFRGVVAVAEIEGMGTWTDTETGQESRLPFLADMRFAVGRYLGVDGRSHRGTFGFL